MPHSSKGPEGELRLYENWSESASGHVETTESAKLTVVDGKLVLTITSDTEKQLPIGRDGWEKKYTINGERLAELIQQNGQRA